MATATATATAKVRKAATVTTGLQSRYASIFGKDEFLDKLNVDRREEIELLGLATLSGVDTLLLGEPGVGKTWMIEALIEHCLVDMRLFSTLLAKDMSADEVLGPRSLTAMKEDKIARITAGFLPEAHYGYLDEVFKASPTLVNPLLDLFANRVLKVGGVKLDCSQLRAIFMSSNELPDREDLMAFRDRIGITKVVLPVRTQEGRREVTDIQLGYQREGIDTNGIEPLTLAELDLIRDEVRAVDVPEAVRDMMCEAQQKWLENGHPPSQRRIGQMWRVVKSHAWAAGRNQVCADDLLPCQHMAFNNLDHAESARSVILEFASAFLRKAERLKQALEPIVAQMEQLKSEVDAAGSEKEKDDLMNGGFSLLRDLRRLRKEGKEQLKDGQKQGHDVSTLEAVLDEVGKAADWTERALTGTDDDDDQIPGENVD